MNFGGTMPYGIFPRSLMVYGLGTMGFHFGDMLNQTFIKERTSDFYEMSLHHIATLALYFTMVYGNNLGVGCVIAYLHDIADIMQTATKVAVSTKFETLPVVCFVLVLTSWFWTRLYVFPQIIYRIMTDEFDDSIWLWARLNGVFLSVLLSLHIYWFCLLILIGLHKARTGKAEDI